MTLLLLPLLLLFPPITVSSTFNNESGVYAPLCSLDKSEFMPYAIINEDGSVWDPETSAHYPNGTYWKLVSGNPSREYLMGCPCELEKPCLRKCCQIGQVMDLSKRCVSNNESTAIGGSWFRPRFTNQSTEISFGILTEKHCWKKGGKILKEEYIIRANDANLCYAKDNFSECITMEDFCVDYVPEKRDYFPVICPKRNNAWTVKFVHTALENAVVNVFKFFTQTVSSLALLAIVYIYVKVPSLRSVHGKCHMCHAICVLTYYTILTILLHSDSLRKAMGICFILGPAEFYFHLAPLSWLNVMSIDVLFAFLNLRPVKSNIKNEGWKKFLIYSFYGWGVPLGTLIITLIGDFVEEENSRPNVNNWCVKGKFRNWDYKRIPMYILLAVNGIIFAATALKIYLLKKESSTIHSGDSRRHSQYDNDSTNQRTKMYLRLLLLMGFHWVLEPLAKALHNILRLDERLSVRLIWYIIAIGNRLQGLFILLMFIGNDKLSSTVWQNFSKSKIWIRLSAHSSVRRIVISSISLGIFSGKRLSTDTIEQDISDISKSPEIPTSSTSSGILSGKEKARKTISTETMELELSEINKSPRVSIQEPSSSSQNIFDESFRNAVLPSYPNSFTNAAYSSDMPSSNAPEKVSEIATLDET